MALNSRRRSGSSDSRNRSSRDASSPRPRSSSVKGRPSGGRSVRLNQPKSARRASSSPSVSSGGPTGRRSTTPHLDRGARRSGALNHGYASSNARGSSAIHSVPVGQVQGHGARRGSGVARWVPRVLVALALLAVIGAVAFAVAYHANVMPITKVTVSGASHLTNEELAKLASVPSGSTLLNVDAAGIEGRLESNPWVKDASVERIPPDTINLKIEERAIAATVDVTVDESATVETWALSDDGLWLCKIPSKKSSEASTVAQQIYDDASSVLKISDVPLGSKPEAGQPCTDANVKNALGIVSGMTTELAGQVKYVSAASAESTTLVLDNGIEVAFGDDTNIRDKERVCLELMKEHEGSISYINVRTVSNPIWRSLK